MLLVFNKGFSVCVLGRGGEEDYIEAMSRKKWLFGSSQAQKEANLPKILNAVLPALHSHQSVLGRKIRSSGGKEEKTL